jgi:hypothetical protein
MMPDPKICIVFNSGAAGDFLVWLLSQQLVELKEKIELEPSGAVVGPGQYFKAAAQEYYETNFNSGVFDSILDEPIVSTHYYYPELLELFPNCEFYFIDDSEYIDITIEMYIKKRITNLKTWLHERPKFLDIKKIQRITDDHIKIIMKNDWRKQLTLWKSFDLQPINLHDILHKDNCLKTIKTILSVDINESKFSHSYEEWSKNNKDFINKVLNERL